MYAELFEANGFYLSQTDFPSSATSPRSVMRDAKYCVFTKYYSTGLLIPFSCCGLSATAGAIKHWSVLFKRGHLNVISIQPFFSIEKNPYISILI